MVSSLPARARFYPKLEAPLAHSRSRVLAFCQRALQRMTTQCSLPVSCAPLWLPNARRQDSPCSSPVLCSPLPRTRWQEKQTVLQADSDPLRSQTLSQPQVKRSTSIGLGRFTLSCIFSLFIFKKYKLLKKK